ncbi:hypothetical protein PHLCEN_2v2619 [Hermanssonia centrifuga]|uniref:Uncharacterized protein n=1 Tax=Hermanssonia centrifuga TaxID=98765 RepID=A0A2R6RIQ8_9APHY|nr:hypothetical protein PHLCEN_2v2619 [Hermanssonia centrifuga]
MIAARSGKSTRANEMESEIGSGRTLQGCNDNLPMRPLAIKITTEVDSDVTVISHHSNSKVPPLEEMKGQDTVDVYQTRRSSITCGADSF